MFEVKGLKCRWQHRTAETEIECSLYPFGTPITKLWIEEIVYSTEGHLTETQVRTWAAKILKNANTDPSLWQS